MKMMKYVLAGLLISITLTANSQENEKNSRIEKLHDQKWQILISHADLTPKEIEAVKPVFMQYEQSLWKLHQDNHEFFKTAYKNLKDVKPNYMELNDRYVEYEFKEALMSKNYHLQLRKLLQPETLFKYYKSEREFKRKLLQDLQDHKDHDRKN
jgi:hypothetical protein